MSGEASQRPLGSRYVVTEALGAGATGRVWRGAERGGGEVAVKVLHPELAGRPDVVARFLRERTLLTAVDHPNVVRVRDLVVEGDTVAVVLDLVDGGDLRSVLSSAPGGTLEPEVAARVTADVLSGLAALHRAGVVHCDVKPENVLVASDGRALVTDAGIARLVHGPEDDGGAAVIGSAEYLAPEVASGCRPAAAADLYAAGVLLYELLFGRTPFAGGHPAAVLWRHQALGPPRPAAVPDRLWALLSSLLAKDPAARPPEAAAALASLEALRPSLVGVAAFPVACEVDFAALDAGPATRDTDLRVLAGAPAPAAAAAAGAPPPGTAGRRSIRRVWVLVAAAAVAVAGVVGVLAMSGGGDGGGPAVTAFAGVPVRQADGLVVTRLFERSGDGGRHVEVAVTLVNDGAAPLDAVFEEALPKSLADGDVDFRPPPQGRPAGGGAEYRVDLEPGERLELSYRTDLDRPAVLADLAAEQRDADDRSRASSGAPPAAALERIEVQPPSLTLGLREAFRLGLAGEMSDGSRASPAVLAGVRLEAGPPGVADLRGTTLIAVGTGTGAVTAQAGPVTARAPLEVVADRPAPTPTTTGPPAGGGADDCGAGAYGWALVDDQAFADPAGSTPADLRALAPGQVAWLVVHARNTGAQPWCRDGAHAVRLATEEPPDHPSALATPEWPSPSRPAGLREGRTEPGGVGSFAFPVKAPATPGPFRQRFNLVVDGVGWMEDIGYSVDGVVVPAAPAP